MYAWIWRKLPYGLYGKLTGSVLLLAGVVALLWYVIFPWAEPLLPFDDVQVTPEGGVPVDPASPGAGGPSDGGQPGDGHDLPYDTGGNDTAPSPTSGR